MPLTCFTGMCGGNKEKRNRTDTLINQINFGLPFSVDDTEKWPGNHLFYLVVAYTGNRLCSYGCGATGAWTLNVFWGSDQHFQIGPSLATLGEADWQKPLSTRHWPSELRGGLPSGHASGAATLASLNLATGFQQELSAAVASRVWSTSLLGVPGLDWICHFFLILALGKHRGVILGVRVHLTMVLNHCIASSTTPETSQPFSQ